jgi:aspartyl protease family protein
MAAGDFFDDGDAGSGIIGWALRHSVIWVAIGLAVYFVLSRMMAPPGDSGPVSAPVQARVATLAPAGNSLSYAANRQGHVVLVAAVNGTAVRFLVDTGATLVALTAKDAAAAGLDPDRLDYRSVISTANGQTRAAPVTLREVRIGQLVLDDVDAVVVERLSTSLLGMSFLSRLGGWAMQDGVLTLSW